MVLVKAVTSSRMHSVTLHTPSMHHWHLEWQIGQWLGTATARISMAVLSFQNQSTASSVSSASFHSMLETIFWAWDLSNLLQVWENANLKQWVLALRFSTFMEESMDRRQKRRPILQRVYVICRREDKQWFMKEITNDTKKTINTISEREDQQHDIHFWMEKWPILCNIKCWLVEEKTNLESNKTVICHWVSPNYNEHIKTWANPKPSLLGPSFN